MGISSSGSHIHIYFCYIGGSSGQPFMHCPPRKFYMICWLAYQKVASTRLDELFAADFMNHSGLGHKRIILMSHLVIRYSINKNRKWRNFVKRNETLEN
jgi:hypothetical protein